MKSAHWLLIFVVTVADYNAWVDGKDTMIGCYLVGLSGIETDRCKGVMKPPDAGHVEGVDLMD